MSAAVPAGPARILVIEHDRAVQKVLKRLFEAEGFAGDIAGNGVARRLPRIPALPRCGRRGQL